MTVSVIGITLTKFTPKMSSNQDYKNFDHSQLLNSVHSEVFNRLENKIIIFD